MSNLTDNQTAHVRKCQPNFRHDQTLTCHIAKWRPYRNINTRLNDFKRIHLRTFVQGNRQQYYAPIPAANEMTICAL